MQIDLTAQYVNPPKKPGGKYGNIKDPNGHLWFVAAEALGQFTAGNTYRVNVEKEMWGDFEADVVRGIVGPEQSTAGPQQVARHIPSNIQHPEWDGHGDTPPPAPPPPQPAPAPPSTQGTSLAPPLPPGIDAKDMHIFVTGVYQRMMQGCGTVPDHDILVAHLNILRSAYIKVMRTDMNDEPGF